MAATLPRTKGQKKGVKGTLKRMFSSRNQEKKGRPPINFDFSKIPIDNNDSRPQRRHSFTDGVKAAAAADDDTLTIFPRAQDLASETESMSSFVDACSPNRTDKRQKELNDRTSSALRKLEQLELGIEVFLAKLEAATADLEKSPPAFSDGKKQKSDNGLKDKNSGADAVWFGTTARDSIECLLEKLKEENNGQTPNWAKTGKQRTTGKTTGGPIKWAKTTKWLKGKTSPQSTTARVHNSQETTTPMTPTDGWTPSYYYSDGDDDKDSDDNDTSPSSSATATKSWTDVSLRRRQQGPPRRRPSAPLKGKTRLVVDLLEAFQRKPLEERSELIRSGLGLLRILLADGKQQTAVDDKEDVAKPKKN